MEAVMSEIDLEQLGKNSKAAAYMLAKLTTNQKNDMLSAVADALVNNAADIISANSVDMENAKVNNMSQGLLDRLLLDEKRIKAMADGLKQVASLNDPIGEVTDMSKR